MRRERASTFEELDPKLEAIIGLHARGIRVANEILTLLREGFPDGALSRWRTLHELAVVSTFLTQNDAEIALRFLSYRGIEEYKALKQYSDHLPRSGMVPLASGELDAAKAHRDHLVAEFGPEFSESMGWAYPIITKKKRINLFDLEKATGLDHWRPRVKWASDEAHASPKPSFANLGMSERRRDQIGRLVGRSDSGFTDPAHMSVISLGLVNHAIPEDNRTENEEILLAALRILSDRVGEVFSTIQNRAE